MSNLTKEEYEKEKNDPKYNSQIQMYEFLKSKESIIGEFEILINISDKENTMKYTRDLKVDPSQYFQTKKGVTRFLVNENFIRALDLYLEDNYFNLPSEIVFKSSKEIFLDIKYLSKEQLIDYVNSFIEDLIKVIQKDINELLLALRNAEMYRLNILLDKYQTEIESPNINVINQCNFLFEKCQCSPKITKNLFDKFNVLISNDIISNQNFKSDKKNYANRMNRFLRDFEKIYYSKLMEEEFVLVDNEEFDVKIENALKKREFRKYIQLFYVQSIKLRNIMKEALNGQR